jgi:hypothetical protein
MYIMTSSSSRRDDEEDKEAGAVSISNGHNCLSSYDENVMQQRNDGNECSAAAGVMRRPNSIQWFGILIFITGIGCYALSHRGILSMTSMTAVTPRHQPFGREQADRTLSTRRHISY